MSQQISMRFPTVLRQPLTTSQRAQNTEATRGRGARPESERQARRRSDPRRVGRPRGSMVGVSMVLARCPQNTVPQDLYDPFLSLMSYARTMFTPTMFSCRWVGPPRRAPMCRERERERSGPNKLPKLISRFGCEGPTGWARRCLSPRAGTDVGVPAK